LLGTRATFSPALYDAFRDAGVVHVLAVSGLHVAVIAGFCAVLLLAVGVPRRFVFLPTMALVFFYGAVVGFPHSVTRSCVMALCASLALFLNRESNGENVLALAAACVVFLSPGALFEAGCQLSFLATWGILAFTGRLTKALSKLRVPRAVGGVLAASVGAEGGILPILAWHFGLLTPIAVAANMLVVPLSSLAVGTGLAGGALDAVFPAAGRIAASAAGLFVALMTKSSAFFASVPWGRMRVPQPPLWFFALYFAGVLLLAYPRRVVDFLGRLRAHRGVS
jgi:competence protein ComEC